MKAKSQREFDPQAFLATIGQGRKILAFRQGDAIFAQGGLTDAVFYVQKGKIKLTVISQREKKQRWESWERAASSEKGAWPARHFAWAQRRP